MFSCLFTGASHTPTLMLVGQSISAKLIKCQYHLLIVEFGDVQMKVIFHESLFIKMIGECYDEWDDVNYPHSDFSDLLTDLKKISVIFSIIFLLLGSNSKGNRPIDLNPSRSSQ